MRHKPTAAQAILLVALCAALTLAAPYLAALLFFAINKTMPSELALDTWWRYWQVYQLDAVQRPRLLGAAIVALVVAYGLPLLAAGKLLRPVRSLHGDARWATAREIRKADLL